MNNSIEQKRIVLWRTKAIKRGLEAKKLRLRHKEVKNSRDTWKEKYFECKNEKEELEGKNELLELENKELKKKL